MRLLLTAVLARVHLPPSQAMSKLVLLFAALVSTVHSIPIPNGQIGKAEVECGEDTIDVVFLTQEIFEGRVYVVGHANESGCQTRDTGKKTTSITVRKDQCDVKTTRSSNPPGLFVNVKVMLSFHSEFVTKVDRGFEISCFYMEAEKTVTFPLTVSMRSLEPFTELAEMPRCRYEVLEPTTKEPLTVVAVGDKLLHKWTCDSSAPGLWCMTVHSCHVEDGTGTQFVILNDQGCSVDKFLLSNLEYGPGNLMAQKEAHAFKFADRVVVNFQCSVRLDIRDGECPHPVCPELRRRVVRSPHVPAERADDSTENIFAQPSVTDVDVRSQQLDVLDPKLDFGLNTNDLRLRSAIERAAEAVRPDAGRWAHHNQCVPIAILLLPCALCCALVLSMIIMIAILWRSNQRLKDPAAY
uniref:ZP domain-containing protein n=2 Tax=Plectus sambesii TaxID=2011161 RepID=A0A914UX55_9BILA